MVDSRGILYLVATPIGNLGDITLRALEVLKSVDAIAAEDTRHSHGLLQHYGIKTKMFSLHEHNEVKRADEILARILRGENVALISDAGTPLISDPGYSLVERARARGVQVIPIPGACAAIAALIGSGFATDSFIFAGFLPRKSTQLAERLQELVTEKRTVIIYEAPHRLAKTLEIMAKVFGDVRRICLAKELTKTFEAFVTGNVSEIQAWLTDEPARQKGEFVVLLEGEQSSSAKNAINSEEIIPDDAARILKILAAELPSKQASELAAKITGAKKRDLYQLALRCK